MIPRRIQTRYSKVRPFVQKRSNSHHLCDSNAQLFEPSAFVRSCAARLVQAAQNTKILDVGCGSGRNAIYLTRLGCTVVCIDRDLQSFALAKEKWKFQGLQNEIRRLESCKLDLLKEPWPFEPGSVGAIINVAFLAPRLFSNFVRSLRPGGLLLLETPPGCGNNYYELPAPGAIKSAFDSEFDFELYKESRVGPQKNQVVVKMLARKHYF
jgi:SAM-dependent methyltransferase